MPAEPWASFLRELDELLKAAADLHCLGGFVVTQQYGIGRETSDIDFLSAVRTVQTNAECECITSYDHAPRHPYGLVWR